MSQSSNSSDHPPLYSLVLGKVLEVLEGGKVKVQLHSIDLTRECLVLQPYAADKSGFFFIPEEGSTVLVACREGELRDSLVLGCLWYGQAHPPIPGDGKNGPKLLKTKGGHKIVLDDTGKAQKIEIADSGGRNRIVIDTARDSITIETGGKLRLLGSDVEIEAQGNLSLKGLTINLN